MISKGSLFSQLTHEHKMIHRKPAILRPLHAKPMIGAGIHRKPGMMYAMRR